MKDAIATLTQQIQALTDQMVKSNGSEEGEKTEEAHVEEAPAEEEPSEDVSEEPAEGEESSSEEANEESSEKSSEESSEEESRIDHIHRRNRRCRTSPRCRPRRRS